MVGCSPPSKTILANGVYCHSPTVLRRKHLLKGYLHSFHEDSGINQYFDIQDVFLGKNRIYKHSSALLHTFKCRKNIYGIHHFSFKLYLNYIYLYDINYIILQRWYFTVNEHTRPLKRKLDVFEHSM